MKRIVDSPWFWFVLPLVLVSAVVLLVRHAPESASDGAAVFQYPLF